MEWSQDKKEIKEGYYIRNNSLRIGGEREPSFLSLSFLGNVLGSYNYDNVRIGYIRRSNRVKALKEDLKVN